MQRTADVPQPTLSTTPLAARRNPTKLVATRLAGASRRRIRALPAALAVALAAAAVAVPAAPSSAVGQAVTTAQTNELRAAGLIGASEAWQCEGDGTSSVNRCLGRFGYQIPASNVSWGKGTFQALTGNCTHYAAWRAKQAGAPSFFDGKANDGVSSYNASTWDEAARAGASRATVSRTPARGAIVQWDGTGFSNHVGYVEYVGRDSTGTVTWFATSEAKYDGGKGGARRAVYNRGTNAFAGAEFIHVGGAPTSTPAPTPATGNAHDYSADGRADLLALKQGTLYRSAGNGAGGLGNAAAVGNGWGAYDRVFSLDINGDGYGDLLARTPAGDLYSYYSKSNGTFTARTKVGHGWATFDRFVGGDFDGDGDGDILAITSTGQLYRSTGNGAGAFTSATQVGSGWSGYKAVAAADIDGDGRTDLVGFKADGVLQYIRSAGSGFATAVPVGSGWGTFSSIVAADFTGDGKADLMARNSAGQLFFYKGNGAGGFASAVPTGQGWGSFDLV